MRRGAPLAAAALLATGAWTCGGAGPAPAASGLASPPPAGYHGAVVWLDPVDGPDTLRVAFDAPWRDTPAGADTALAFAGQDAGGGWRAHGRLRGDTLTWGLGRLQGDAGSALDFSGVVEADGTVRGCALPVRRLAGPPGPRAAFVLAPRDRPAPPASGAPAARCAARP